MYAFLSIEQRGDLISFLERRPAWQRFAVEAHLLQASIKQSHQMSHHKPVVIYCAYCSYITVVPKLFRAFTQIEVVIRSYHPQYLAVIAHNIEQNCGLGSVLPPEELHITPGGNLPPVWEPLVYNVSHINLLTHVTKHFYWSCEDGFCWAAQCEMTFLYIFQSYERTVGLRPSILNEFLTRQPNQIL